MYEKVLMPLDSSKVAQSALPYAEELAGHLKSELTLLYVCPPGDESSKPLHEQYLRIISEGVIREIGERYQRKRGAKVNAVVLVGKPADEIIDYASKNDISLIVLATHPRSGLMHRTTGHTVDKVLQEANMPIMLLTTEKAYPEAGPRQLIDRILLPLDGSGGGEAVLPYVAEFAKKLWTQVTLLQVIDPSQHVHTVGGLTHVKFTEQQIESMKARAQAYLEGTGKKLAGTKAFIRYEVRVGNATKEIVNVAKEMNARLIAISPRHYPRFKFLVSGSVGQQLMQATDIPVLMVRAQS